MYIYTYVVCVLTLRFAYSFIVLANVAPFSLQIYCKTLKNDIIIIRESVVLSTYLSY